MNLSSKAALFGIVFLVAAGVFIPAIHNDFVFDDVTLIIRNPTIAPPVNPVRIFGSHYWAPEPAQGLYRPLVILSFAIERALWDLNPAPTRLANLFLHGVVAGLLFILALRLFRAKGPAVAAALLFAVHPVQTEAVINAVGRADLLVALCAVACILFYFKFVESKGGRAAAFLSLGGLAFLFGLLSKESAVAIPLLIVAFHLVPRAENNRRGRKLLWFMAALAAAGAVWFVLRWNALEGEIIPRAQVSFVSNPIAHFAFPSDLAGALRVLGHAFFILVFPLRLSADYSYNHIPLPAGLFNPAVLAAAAVAMAWWFFGLRFRKRHPVLLLSAALFFLSWFPVSNWPLPIGTVFGERLLYLPAAGFCLLAGFLLFRLSAAYGKGGAVLAAGLMGLVALCFIIRIEQRIPDFRNEVVFHERLVETAPESYPAHFHLATIYQSRGQAEKAMDAYRRAREIYDKDSESAYRLGMLLLKAQKPVEAIGFLDPLAKKYPDSAKINGLLGMAYQATGVPEKAVVYLERARRVEPENAEINIMVAEIKINSDRVLAGVLAGRAMTLARKDPVIQARAGRVLMQAGNLAPAEEALRRAVALWPEEGGSGPVKTLSVVLVRMGKAGKAVQVMDEAIARDPGDVMLWNNLAWALSAAGTPETLERARSTGEQALKMSPGSPDILDTLAEIYLKLGKRDRALDAARQALAHAPPERKAHFEARLEQYFRAR